MAAIESLSMSPSAGALTREWSLARTKACCRYVVSHMQVSVSGVARWSLVTCFAIIGLMAAVISYIHPEGEAVVMRNHGHHTDAQPYMLCWLAHICTRLCIQAVIDN
ncbi:hypothetical protein BDR03DRAFT_971808 [Suillus americanus]|nr:hypothetical protein BDR03DRAFT_971808 [Suillus americanus]